MLLIVLSVLLAQGQPPQLPVRDARPAVTKGTAVIRGRVTDRATGLPVSRVRVSAIDQRPSEPSARPSAFTDAEGRFEIRALPAGAYILFCAPTEHDARFLHSMFGARGPIDPSRYREPAGTRITLAEGEVREKADIALWRALSIEGRVVDDRGEPMARVQVMVLDENGEDPRAGRPMRETDDLGRFRLFGLRPGAYTLFAETHGMPTREGQTIGVVPTYFPSTTIVAEAEIIRLTTEDLSAIELRMRQARMLAISGTATDSRGRPLGVGRGSVGVERIGRSGSASTSVRMTAPGQFELTGVAPGEYRIYAHLGDWNDSGEPRERGDVRVRVEDANVSDVAIVTSPLVNVGGRVIFEDAAIPPEGAASVTVSGVAERRGSGGYTSLTSVRVRPDLTFALKEVAGTHTLTAGNLPRGWFIKGIRYGDEDITDKAMEFGAAGAQSKRLQVLLTRRAAEVRGRVTDDKGNAVANAGVLLFSTDPARWKLGLTTTAFGMTRDDGSFTIAGRRPGEYFIVPTDEWEPFPLALDRTIKSLMPFAERITLTDEDRRVVDLRLRRQ